MGRRGGPKDHDHDKQGPVEQAEAVREGAQTHLPGSSEAEQRHLRVQTADGSLQVFNISSCISMSVHFKCFFRANAVTDFLVVHEHRGVPDGLVVCHLPHGPTAYFTMSDIVMRQDNWENKLNCCMLNFFDQARHPRHW